MTKIELIRQNFRIDALETDLAILKNLLFLAHHENRSDYFCSCGNCEETRSADKDGAFFINSMVKEKIRLIEAARRPACPTCGGTRSVIEYGDGDSMFGAPCPECKGDPAPAIR